MANGLVDRSIVRDTYVVRIDYRCCFREDKRASTHAALKCIVVRIATVFWNRRFVIKSFPYFSSPSFGGFGFSFCLGDRIVGGFTY